MYIVNISEAKTQSDLIRKVMNGEKVVIAINNNPIVELKKLVKMKQYRIPNLYKGQVRVIGQWEDSDKLLKDLMLSSNLNIGEVDPF